MTHDGCMVRDRIHGSYVTTRCVHSDTQHLEGRTSMFCLVVILTKSTTTSVGTRKTQYCDTSKRPDSVPHPSWNPGRLFFLVYLTRGTQSRVFRSTYLQQGLESWSKNETDSISIHRRKTPLRFQDLTPMSRSSPFTSISLSQDERRSKTREEFVVVRV